MELTKSEFMLATSTHTLIGTSVRRGAENAHSSSFTDLKTANRLNNTASSKRSSQTFTVKSYNMVIKVRNKPLIALKFGI